MLNLGSSIQCHRERNHSMPSQEEVPSREEVPVYTAKTLPRYLVRLQVPIHGELPEAILPGRFLTLIFSMLRALTRLTRQANFTRQMDVETMERTLRYATTRVLMVRSGILAIQQLPLKLSNPLKMIPPRQVPSRVPLHVLLLITV